MSVTSRSPRSIRLMASRLTAQPMTAARPARSSCVRFCCLRRRCTVFPIELRSVRLRLTRRLRGMGELSPANLMERLRSKGRHVAQ